MIHKRCKVLVITRRDSSNDFLFLYAAVGKSVQVPKFSAKSSLGALGASYPIKDITAVRVGPHGRFNRPSKDTIDSILSRVTVELHSTHRNQSSVQGIRGECAAQEGARNSI